MKTLFDIVMIAFGLILTSNNWIEEVASQSESELLTSHDFVFVQQINPAAQLRFQPINDGLTEGFDKETLFSQIEIRQSARIETGWFIYGDEHSQSVAVALINEDDDEDTQRLYVDASRDKVFQKGELVLFGEPGLWRTRIDAEFVVDDLNYELVRRSIFIRHREGKFEVATAGSMKGFVIVDGKKLLAERLDRNANGRWFDSTDRILIDRNGDEKLNSISERIGCTTVCKINSQRYLLESDNRGDRLNLKPLIGEGSLTSSIDLENPAELQSVRASLVSQGGVRVEIRNLDKPIKVPVGDYRIESLKLEMKTDEKTYSFNFATLKTTEHPISVKSDQHNDIDLIGEIRLDSSIANLAQKEATVIKLNPMLTTSSGLYLTNSNVGKGHGTVENRLTTISQFNGQPVGNGSSGFT